MKYDDKVIVMDNDKKYIVIEQVEYDEHIYLYLVNRENDKDSKFVEIRDNQVFNIEPELFKEKIFPLFNEAIAKE